MTTLASKLQEVAKRLQHLTVWRPNEQDPFIELDRWRMNAHAAIEDVFNKKKYEIQHHIESHEREFMRQLTRQRLLLNNIRQRLQSQKDVITSDRISNDVSILADLKRIEKEIDTRLGRADIIIQADALNPHNLVSVSLKTYLSATASIYDSETSILSEPRSSRHMQIEDLSKSFDARLKIRRGKETTSRKKLVDVDEQQQKIRKVDTKHLLERSSNTKADQARLMKRKFNTKNVRLQTAET